MSSRKYLWIAAGLFGIGILLLIIITIFFLPQKVVEKSRSSNRRVISVAYLSPVVDHPEVWRKSLDGREVIQLTHTENGVIDYDVSPDGEYIVYSSGNSLGGSDIWLTDRDGKSQTLLVSCGVDRCFSVTFAQNESVFAYIVESSEGREGRKSSVVLYDIGKRNQIDRITDISSSVSSLSWSPNGSRLAFFDLDEQNIRIRNLLTDQEINISTNYDMAVVWFPDSLSILTGKVEMYKEGNPRITLYEVDLEHGEAQELSAINGMNLDFTQPVISPDGLWIALAGCEAGNSFSKQVWIFDRDWNWMEEVTREENFIHASIRWSPSGKMLVYQRLEVNTSDAKPEIWIWNWEDRTKQQVATDAAIPKWLP